MKNETSWDAISIPSISHLVTHSSQTLVVAEQFLTSDDRRTLAYLQPSRQFDSDGFTLPAEERPKDWETVKIRATEHLYIPYNVLRRKSLRNHFAHFPHLLADCAGPFTKIWQVVVRTLLLGVWKC